MFGYELELLVVVFYILYYLKFIKQRRILSFLKNLIMYSQFSYMNLYYCLRLHIHIF